MFDISKFFRNITECCKECFKISQKFARNQMKCSQNKTKYDKN